MPPLPFKCAMCKKIARPAVSFTVDSTKDWEAAVLHNQGPADPAKIKPGACPVSGRADGRIDLVLCVPCAEERRELEAIEESKNDDDAREDAELEQALRLSMTDEQKSLLDGQAREDAELAEALRLSMSDARPAEPEKALRSSNGPPEKRSDLDAELEKALRLSMLDAPPEERSDSDEEPEALRQSEFALRLSELEAQRKANEDPEALRQPRWEADDWVLIDEEPRSSSSAGFLSSTQVNLDADVE